MANIYSSKIKTKNNHLKGWDTMKTVKEIKRECSDIEYIFIYEYDGEYIVEVKSEGEYIEVGIYQNENEGMKRAKYLAKYFDTRVSDGINF
jgi:hypothetical protein